MKKKRLAAGIGMLLILLVGLAYHFIFGYVASTRIDDQITVLTRKNILSQIGANVVVYTDRQGTFIIDTQLSPFASSTRSAVNALVVAPISKVLITHWHPDHSGGISAFSSDVGVIAHDNVKRRLATPQEGFGLTKPGSHHQFDARSADGLPDQTVSRPLELTTASTTVHVVHYPKAHTDGDLVFYFHNSQVAMIGDLIWPNSFPYVDLHNGGSVEGLESALRAILDESKPGYRFIPGHGTAQSYEDVGTYLEMVRSTRQWITAQIEKGKTVEQINASGLPEKWKKWGSPLVPSNVWIEMIHASHSVSMAVEL